MRKVYYNSMRKLSGAVPFLAVCLMAGAYADAQQSGGQRASLKTASLETHEGLTISAQPWTDAALYKEKFPKKSPFTAGIVAMQVVFRNDSNESMKVSLDRIRLSFQIDQDNRQEVQALTPAQVADQVLKPGAKDPAKSRARIPLPVSVPHNNDKHWTELEQQAEVAGIPANVIAPHSSVQGLLYFDLQGQFDLLNEARLYVPDILVMENNRSLTYFEIDLSKSTGK
ncbi:MAG TPA: hypothetical protein VLA42_10760 [Verrucomicrobiae bacterium]|nr:hypothetical protein [Verrucomicrobiae bacterium]